MRKMGINPSRIKPTKTTFKGIILGVEACCMGSITLEVVFGSPDNHRVENLVFDIVPFCSDHQPLLGRTAFARFNVVPHYAYHKLKMPGPCGIIMVSGRSKFPLTVEEDTTALTTRTTDDTLQSNLQSKAKLSDTTKGVRTTAQQDSPARPKIN